MNCELVKQVRARANVGELILKIPVQTDVVQESIRRKLQRQFPNAEISATFGLYGFGSRSSNVEVEVATNEDDDGQAYIKAKQTAKEIVIKSIPYAKKKK